MIDLENIGHDMQFAKRVTHFGALIQKLWLVEVPCTLGRERSSTFMLDKISFEPSLMLESQVESGPKTCHFWKV